MLHSVRHPQLGEYEHASLGAPSSEASLNWLFSDEEHEDRRPPKLQESFLGYMDSNLQLESIDIRPTRPATQRNNANELQRNHDDEIPKNVLSKLTGNKWTPKITEDGHANEGNNPFMYWPKGEIDGSGTIVWCYASAWDIGRRGCFVLQKNDVLPPPRNDRQLLRYLVMDGTNPRQFLETYFLAPLKKGANQHEIEGFQDGKLRIDIFIKASAIRKGDWDQKKGRIVIKVYVRDLPPALRSEYIRAKGIDEGSRLRKRSVHGEKDRKFSLPGPSMLLRTETPAGGDWSHPSLGRRERISKSSQPTIRLDAGGHSVPPSSPRRLTMRRKSGKSMAQQGSIDGMKGRISRTLQKVRRDSSSSAADSHEVTSNTRGGDGLMDDNASVTIELFGIPPLFMEAIRVCIREMDRQKKLVKELRRNEEAAYMPKGMTPVRAARPRAMAGRI